MFTCVMCVWLAVDIFMFLMFDWLYDVFYRWQMERRRIYWYKNHLLYSLLWSWYVLVFRGMFPRQTRRLCGKRKKILREKITWNWYWFHFISNFEGNRLGVRVRGYIESRKPVRFKTSGDQTVLVVCCVCWELRESPMYRSIYICLGSRVSLYRSRRTF